MVSALGGIIAVCRITRVVLLFFRMINGIIQECSLTIAKNFIKLRTLRKKLCKNYTNFDKNYYTVG